LAFDRGFVSEQPVDRESWGAVVVRSPRRILVLPSSPPSPWPPAPCDVRVRRLRDRSVRPHAEGPGDHPEQDDAVDRVRHRPVGGRRRVWVLSASQTPRATWTHRCVRGRRLFSAWSSTWPTPGRTASTPGSSRVGTERERAVRPLEHHRHDPRGQRRRVGQWRGTGDCFRHGSRAAGVAPL